MDTLTYKNVTNGQVQAMLVKMEADHDIVVTPNADGSYAFAGDGIVATATYDAPSSVLTVDVSRHPGIPFFMHVMNGKIKFALSQS